MRNLTNLRKSTIARLDTIEKARSILNLIVKTNPLTDDEREAFEQVLDVLSDDTKLWRRADFVIAPEEKDQYII